MLMSATEIAGRLAVEDVVTRMFVATDERDWHTLETCFTNPVTLDMTSMSGGDPALLPPAQVAQSWADGFKSLDHVHHQIGNLRTQVVANDAHVECYGVALHHRAAAKSLKTRVFVGTYGIDLVAAPTGWKISRLVFRLKFIDGNLDLESA